LQQTVSIQMVIIGRIVARMNRAGSNHQLNDAV
jgi:hypothetical protein